MTALQRKVKKQDLVRQLAREYVMARPKVYRALQKKAELLLRAEVLVHLKEQEARSESATA